MPDETCTFNDLIRGEVTVEGTEIGDFVIAKQARPEHGSTVSSPSNGRGYGSPVFHLSNVVDDAEMTITHVIRGEDHLPNVPKHVALFRALGYEPPVYAHLPLILNPDGSKMSKRKTIEGLEPYVRVFREKGYLAEALVNYLALLGWSPGDDREQLTLSQLTEVFSLEHVSKSGARFDLHKLNDLNGQYIRRLPDEEFERQLRARFPQADADYLRRIIPLVRERLNRFEEAPGYMRFFFEDIEYDVQLLKPKKCTLDDAAAGIKAVLAWLESMPTLAAEVLDARMRQTAEQLGWKAADLFMVVRVAVTGSTATPPLFATMEVLGKERCLRRLRAALKKLAGM
jgi:glutamyl-tRNA synthetase